MKKVVWTAVIACAVFVAGVHASDAMKSIVGSYLDIQARLASDKFDGVAPAAHAIASQAARMGTGGEALAKSAQAVEQAADIKAARKAFGDLSDAVIDAAKAEGWKDLPDVKVAYCPMAKRSWIQKEDSIRNPYYGTSMLTCGSFTKK
jgi:HPt (histidine-containing phosphotransfer) domain-containing protein